MYFFNGFNIFEGNLIVQRLIKKIMYIYNSKYEETTVNKWMNIYYSSLILG